MYFKQAWIRSETIKISAPESIRFVREAKMVKAPKKRKLAEIYNEEDKERQDSIEVDDGDEEVMEMFCPFVRGHYNTTGMDLPKTVLLNWARYERHPSVGIEVAN
jgi:hypothetical protein